MKITDSKIFDGNGNDITNDDALIGKLFKDWAFSTHCGGWNNMTLFK